MSARFPAEFVERVGRQLGVEVDDFLRALAAPAEGLRVNTIRVSPERFEAAAPFEVERLPFPAEAFRLGPGVRAGRHPYHAAGVYYLQDPGAMTVGALVDPRPGERVIDLAAAPGGKTTHLAARMVGQGLLVANDVSRTRARELSGNLERCGVANAVVLNESIERLSAHFGGWFDRVLLDAPCSGESMFHKSAAAVDDWSPAAVAGCARRQSEIIDHAADLTAPGGLLVYSTCTFATEENEAVVETFLARRRDFEPATVEAVPGAAAAGPGGIRLWPHRVPGAGHFIAVLRRVDGEGSAGPGPDRGPPPAREVTDLLRDLCQAALPAHPLGVERLRTHGRELYSLPEDAPSLEGLRVVRRGLPMGTIERGRVEPAHALAMAAGQGRSPCAVDLELNDPRVERYLRGHPIESSGAAGWVPVRVDGFPLGWGKRVASTVKNHYPKGLRTRG